MQPIHQQYHVPCHLAAGVISWPGAICTCVLAAWVAVLLLQAGLALEWVYGYNASNTAYNAYYTSQQKIVYYLAALGVVYDPATHTQQFFQVSPWYPMDMEYLLMVSSHWLLLCCGSCGGWLTCWTATSLLTQLVCQCVYP